jgi:type IV secretion system protein VirB5
MALAPSGGAQLGKELQMKKLLASIALVLSSLCGQAAHAGIPVVDVTSVAIQQTQLVQAIQQVAAWAQQYQQMMSQIQQAQQQYASLTGARGLGDILNNQLLQGVVPADVSQIYSAINAGGFNSLTGAAKTLRSATMIYNCEGRQGQDLQICQSLLNTNAQTQAFQQNALSLITQRVGQIQSLQSQINTTQDPKAIAELQARLQAENTQVANDSNRIAVMQALAESQQRSAQQQQKERELKWLSLPDDGTAGFEFKVVH